MQIQSGTFQNPFHLSDLLGFNRLLIVLIIILAFWLIQLLILFYHTFISLSTVYLILFFTVMLLLLTLYIYTVPYSIVLINSRFWNLGRDYKDSYYIFIRSVIRSFSDYCTQKARPSGTLSGLIWLINSYSFHAWLAAPVLSSVAFR